MILTIGWTRVTLGFADSGSQYQLTISASADGTTIPAPGNYTYSYMANVTVTAVPDSGYMLDGWLLDGNNWAGPEETTVTVTMDGNHVLQPLFALAPTSVTLTINAAPEGTTRPPPGNYTYGYMANVTVTAVPDQGYMLNGWTLDGHGWGAGNQVTLTMDRDHVLQPVFAVAPTSVTLTINATSGGTTDPQPGTYTYSYMSNVTITAIPDSGYIFDYWISGYGPMGSQNPNTITMTQNMSLQLVFENASTAQRTLTITSATGGTTDPQPGTYNYAYMANVTVTAIANTGYVFDHWTTPQGGYFGNQNPWTITLNSNMTIQPDFENATSGQRTLMIWQVTNGTTDPPPGTYTYDYGENVTVTAIPENGTYFDGWILDRAGGGMSNPITITMDSSHTLGANFGPSPPTTVTLTISPATGGTTDPPPGQYTYPAGNPVKVTAIPDSGWWLEYWLLNGNNYGNSTTIEFPLKGNQTVRPVFNSSTVVPTSFMLTVNAADGGTTNPSPGTYTYNYGESVTVTATPNSGLSFDHWILDGQNVNQNPITVQMTQDHTLQPVFTSSQGGQTVSFSIPSNFILMGALTVIAILSIGYLVPLAVAIRKGKVPENTKKPRLILALLSILIIAAPLGATLLVYSGNLNGMFKLSNITNITNLFSSSGGIAMPSCTSSWFNLTTRTFGIQFNFTNPTPTDLTLIAFSANLVDHSDDYSLGNVSLVNPVTAAPKETVTFEVTSPLSAEAVVHVENTYSGASSFDVDLSDIKVNFAGIQLQISGTTTINVSI
jgi:hypothetical protein